ncbi:hypothetical protein GCM10023161_49000 [Mycobacterium paraffinicum]|uniref:Uncharacterized protein n=1 Tax=Mycobacterium paraffinicum TaxID=53378 RepID=A0ABP8F7T9_9MYCO
MVRARIDRLKEDWFLVLGTLAALSTPQLGIIYGFADRPRAQEPVGQVAPASPPVVRPRKFIA